MAALVDTNAQGLLGWYGQPWVIERLHRHSDIELNFVASGRLEYLIGGSRVVLKAGEIAVYWALTPHCIIECSDDSRLGVLHIPLTEFLRWDLPLRIREALLNGSLQTCTSQHPDFDTALFRRWASDLQRSYKPTAITEPMSQYRAVLLEAEAFLYRFAKLDPSQNNALHPGSAERLAQLIAQSYTNQISAKKLADELDLHPHYAMTLFKQAFGLTIHEFVTQHRIAHAQRLLMTTEQRVLDVALESGFQSLSRFYAVFGRFSGMSPRQYRHRHKLESVGQATTSRYFP